MRRSLCFALIAVIAAACRRTPPATTPTPTSRPPAERPLAHSVVPNPERIEVTPRDSFLITPRTVVYVEADASDEIAAIGDYAANVVSSVFGTKAQRLAAGSTPPDSSIVLSLDSSRASLGAEGYELTVTSRLVRIVAATPAGLFYGVQTIRQLLPPSVESRASYTRRLVMPAAHVVDRPRFAWRGAMLDVSRHFLRVEDVRRFIDLYALYKINRLHLHLSDDQGWRIEIKSWPRLTEIGGPMAIGNAPAGYYTQQQYADLVAYARSRYITIVPEIDMPGHITAALVAYPDLRCDRVAPEPFLRVGGPPNSLCVTRDSVYTFVRDVVREITQAAPTPYFHFGGDEVARMSPEDYQTFVERVSAIVDSTGARPIGWSEIATAKVAARTIVQHWTKDSSAAYARRGGKLILSPGPQVYIDMKYDGATVLGLKWAGLIDLRGAYDWDPETLIPDVESSSILGIEAPLWAETLITRQDYEYMAFPRLIAIAELAWSPQERRGWENFRRRIAKHGERLALLGVNFARTPGVDWTW